MVIPEKALYRSHVAHHEGHGKQAGDDAAHKHRGADEEPSQPTVQLPLRQAATLLMALGHLGKAGTRDVNREELAATGAFALHVAGRRHVDVGALLAFRADDTVFHFS